MKQPQKETDPNYDEIVKIIGEEKIEKLYAVLGARKFSVASVKNFIKKKKIISAIQQGIPFGKIAAQAGITRMTVYRYFGKTRKSNRLAKNVTTSLIHLPVMFGEFLQCI